jgi:NAD(P)-dependent dehydrogenase (short-subunit alcohol dehydrogenase family)
MRNELPSFSSGLICLEAVHGELEATLVAAAVEVLPTSSTCMHLQGFAAVALAAPAQHSLRSANRLSLLLCAAVTGASQHALAAETTDQVAEALLDINALAPIRLTQAVLPYMLKR